MEKIEEKGNCPDCLEGWMRWHSSEHSEPHGEFIRQEWWECSTCGFIEGSV